MCLTVAAYFLIKTMIPKSTRVREREREIGRGKERERERKRETD